MKAHVGETGCRDKGTFQVWLMVGAEGHAVAAQRFHRIVTEPGFVPELEGAR